MSEKIALREVGMRDGLQSIATVMPTETKIAWLDAEYAAGVRYVEVSSFVPPRLLPQLADAEAIIAHAMTLPGLHVSALIPNSRGAERGMALGVPEMNYVLSVSNGHNLSNVRRPTEDSIEDFRRVVAVVPPGQRQAGADQLRACHVVRLQSIEGDVDEDRHSAHRRRTRSPPRPAPTGSSSPTRSATTARRGDRAGVPQGHRRCVAAAGRGALP